MKHYGASLAGLSNTVDGGENSVLTVGANDSIVITTNRAAGSAANPTDLDDGSVDGLIINTPNAATHILGADGREVSIANISGGGHGSTFNATVDTLPILGQNGSGAYEWEDSLISQTGGTRTASLSVDGTLSFAVASGQYNISLSIPTTAFAGLAAGARADFLADFPMGSGVGVPANITIGTTRYFGTLDRTSLDADDPITASFRGSSPFPAIAANTTVSVHFDGHESTHNAVNIGGDLIVTNDATINGNLTVVGTLQRQETTVNTLLVEDKYIVANHSSGTTTQDGGMLVQLETAVNQASNTGQGTTPNQLGTHAGIRFDESTGNWQTSVGTTNSGGIDGDWVNIGSGTLSSVQVDAGSGLSINGSGNVQVSSGNANFDILSGSEFVTTGAANAGGSNAAAKTGGSHLVLNTTADSTGSDRGEATASASNYLLAANIANPGQLTWVAPASGTVNTATIPFSKTNGATFIRINNTGATGQSGVTVQHGLGTTSGGTNGFTVQVYEDGTNVMQQIIPQQIFVYEGVVAAGSNLSTADTADGDIIIQFGATDAALNGKVVIKR